MAITGTNPYGTLEGSKVQSLGNDVQCSENQSSVWSLALFALLLNWMYKSASVLSVLINAVLLLAIYVVVKN